VIRISLDGKKDFDIFAARKYSFYLFEPLGGSFWILKRGPTGSLPKQRSAG
jgi:hypothetical protein